MGAGALVAAGIVAPIALPTLLSQLALLWVMVLFALTWDLVGGQMGYNSFGNVLFFGLGCYAGVVVPRELGLDYFPGIAAGMAGAVLVSVAAAALLGSALLGLRGHYFAISTLGLGLAAAELVSGWDFVGAGGGLQVPGYPGSLHARGLFFYVLAFLLALLCLGVLALIYRSRFGLALNAVRDDEDKAEAMGLPTVRIKVLAWVIAALFLAPAGVVVGYLIGFIDPREVAFAGSTYGVWMVLMAILGGRGTLWGPVIGAVLFHVTQELFWTYLLGWQRVAMGVAIVAIVVFFPNGLMGWLRQARPAWFAKPGPA